MRDRREGTETTLALTSVLRGRFLIFELEEVYLALDSADDPDWILAGFWAWERVEASFQEMGGALAGVVVHQDHNPVFTGATTGCKSAVDRRGDAGLLKHSNRFRFSGSDP